MTVQRLLALGGMTAVLWVIPSIGTQGMGTIGRRVVHPDAVLFDTDAAQRQAARETIRRADAVVETATGT